MPRTKEPWRRERILDAALELMSGPRAAQLRIADVAEAAGTSPAAVHYHFEDLSGLVLAAMGLAGDQMHRSRQDAIAPLDDPVAKLRTLVELGVPDTASAALVIMYTATGLIRVDAGAVSSGREHIESQVALYQAVIEQGQAEGRFAAGVDANTVAVNLVALEDAFDLYLVLGIVPDGALGRSRMFTYLESTLFLEPTRSTPDI